jgi:hypothetical protein
MTEADVERDIAQAAQRLEAGDLAALRPFAAASCILIYRKPHTPP